MFSLQRLNVSPKRKGRRHAQCGPAENREETRHRDHTAPIYAQWPGGSPDREGPELVRGWGWGAANAMRGAGMFWN